MFAYTGGKTGGHIMPLIALIRKFPEQAIYIGQKDSLEERICKENHISFIGIKPYSDRIRSMVLGYLDLKEKMKDKKIEALIASGGFVSFPACFYAILHKIPVFLLEENRIIGNFNRIIYPFCKKMFLAYPLAKMKKKMVVTGLPLREKGWSIVKYEYDVLIIGGSLGSTVLSKTAETISKQYKTLLIAGKYAKEYKENPNLKILEFSSDIYTLMKKSRLIIARAGASTTAEIFYVNRPFICIPSRKTKRNHQYYNARYFEEEKACVVCLEQDIDTTLLSHIHNILGNETLRMNMLNAQKKLVSENAGSKIYEVIKESIK